MSKLSEKLIEIRTANNLTQEKFSEELFVTRQAVSKWERDICYPDIEILKKIAVKYKISLNLLLDIIKQNKNEEIKNLADKSYAFMVIMILGTLVCLADSVFLLINAIIYNDQNFAFQLMGFLIAGIVGAIITIPLIISPKKPIKYNDFGLFICTMSMKNIFIKYEDIVNVVAKTTHSRTINYSFGKIIIKTKAKNYIMRNVRQVDSVKGKIIELKTLNTYSEI